MNLSHVGSSTSSRFDTIHPHDENHDPGKYTARDRRGRFSPGNASKHPHSHSNALASRPRSQPSASFGNDAPGKSIRNARDTSLSGSFKATPRPLDPEVRHSAVLSINLGLIRRLSSKTSPSPSYKRRLLYQFDCVVTVSIYRSDKESLSPLADNLLIRHKNMAPVELVRIGDETEARVRLANPFDIVVDHLQVLNKKTGRWRSGVAQDYKLAVNITFCQPSHVFEFRKRLLPEVEAPFNGSTPVQLTASFHIGWASPSAQISRLNLETMDGEHSKELDATLQSHVCWLLSQGSLKDGQSDREAQIPAEITYIISHGEGGRSSNRKLKGLRCYWCYWFLSSLEALDVHLKVKHPHNQCNIMSSYSQGDILKVEISAAGSPDSSRLSTASLGGDDNSNTVFGDEPPSPPLSKKSLGTDSASKHQDSGKIHRNVPIRHSPTQKPTRNGTVDSGPHSPTDRFLFPFASARKKQNADISDEVIDLTGDEKSLPGKMPQKGTTRTIEHSVEPASVNTRDGNERSTPLSHRGKGTEPTSDWKASQTRHGQLMSPLSTPVTGSEGRETPISRASSARSQAIQKPIGDALQGVVHESNVTRFVESQQIGSRVRTIAELSDADGERPSVRRTARKAVLNPTSRRPSAQPRPANKQSLDPEFVHEEKDIGLAHKESHTNRATSKRNELTPTPTKVRPLPRKRAKYQIPAHPAGNRFYRTLTKRPLNEGELVSESDDDTDMRWLTQLHHRDLEQLSLSASEVAFLKLFDGFISKARILGDRFVPDAVKDFARNEAGLLSADAGLKREFARKLCWLKVIGILDTACIRDCLETVKAAPQTAQANGTKDIADRKLYATAKMHRRGDCAVCNRDVVDMGDAVFCAEPLCQSQLFHARCFAAHEFDGSRSSTVEARCARCMHLRVLLAGLVGDVRETAAAAVLAALNDRSDEGKALLEKVLAAFGQDRRQLDAGET